MGEAGGCLFELFGSFLVELFGDYVLRGIWVVILLIFSAPYFMIKALFGNGPWWTNYKTINGEVIQRVLPSDEQRKARAAKRQLRKERSKT